MRGSIAGFSAAGSHVSGAPVDTPLLQWADVVFASVVVTPASVAYWKSTWTLMDLYIYPDDPMTNAAACAIFGLCFSVFLCMFQSQFSKYISPDRGRVTYYVLSRLYSEVAGVICIGAVKGVWDLMDSCAGDSFSSVLWTTSAAILALAALRTLRNICAIPFVVVLDTPQDHFDVPTFFRKNTKETMQYILDCIFSVCVVGTLVISVWRGLWALADLLFYPEDSLKSLIVSLILGYGLTIAIFALQSPMRWLATKLDGAPKLLLADVNNLVSFVATINVWRGFWVYMDDFFFPETPELANWMTHFVSLFALVLLNCFNTVLVRGVYFDAEEPADECMVFPCHYIRIHYQRRKMRKKFRDAISTAEKNKLEDSNVPLQIDVRK
ncbi:fuseless domain-containing protein [Phthorimaea operculella]|nr:fuseless domain-containing protein [Phthorimaea operculella]